MVSGVVRKAFGAGLSRLVVRTGLGFPTVDSCDLHLDAACHYCSEGHFTSALPAATTRFTCPSRSDSNGWQVVTNDIIPGYDGYQLEV